jgi:type I site-specific restriction endonuclease
LQAYAKRININDGEKNMILLLQFVLVAGIVFAIYQNSLILQKLNSIKKELRKLVMGLQEIVDGWTEQLENDVEGVAATITAEKAQVKEAIENPDIDTAAFEAALGKVAELKDLVADIHTPKETETPEPTKPEGEGEGEPVS